jgi:hypothetical protein
MARKISSGVMGVLTYSAPAESAGRSRVVSADVFVDGVLCPLSACESFDEVANALAAVQRLFAKPRSD